jgi:hypothetical protein
MGDATGSAVAGSPTISAVGVNSYVGVPAPVISGTAESGRVATGSVSLLAPVIAGTGDTGNLMVGDVAARRSTVYALGFEGAPLSAPAPTIASTGLSGTASSGIVLIDAAVLSGTMLSGGVVTGSVTTPKVIVSGGTGSYGKIGIPEVGVTATGFSGNAGAGGVRAKLPTLSGSLFQDNTGSVSVSLRAPVINATTVGDLVGLFTISVNRATVSGTGHSGSVSTGAVSALAPSISSNWFHSNTATGSIVLPPATIVAAGIVNDGATVTYAGVALNTRNRAATEYTNVQYHSMCVFNGVVLAATSAGIVELVGTTDQGTAIDASVRGAVSNLDSTKVKKVINTYTSIRADGELRFVMRADDGVERKYRLRPRNTGIHAAKASLGLGVQGVHWQWGLENYLGNHFELNQLVIDMEETDRRVL